ncbi:MAG: hypothetical protein N2596_03405 [Syntrophorhabdaceae bacterium]|nr:hypothetical protein [Syntrophorhabdaceae bacterium]
MKIHDSVVKLSSQYNYTLGQKNTRVTLIKPVVQREQIEISFSSIIKQKSQASKLTCESPENDHLTEKQRIARFLIELMFGVRIYGKKLSKTKNETTQTEGQPQSEQFEIINIDFSERHEEEHVNISATGSIKTKEGNTYDFNLSVSFDRFLYEAGVSINRQVQGKDPLILNLSGTFKGLSDKTIDFDIDGDGTNDRIHFVREGSGILVIDKNSDGKINDGREVIGTNTGNALSELASYDDDKNGWIDEADTIFVRLAIWEKDKSGNNIVTPIKEKGIGAICLASAMTPFHIKTTDTAYGKIYDTGVFLFENGKTSTFHRVDLFV